MFLQVKKISLVLACCFITPAMAAKVEVLHWWTSGGEAVSASALKSNMEARGHEWEDFAIAGGGGDAAMTTLKSRVVSGNPPTAAQVKGPAIVQWAEEGVLTSMDDVAKAQDWDSVIPKAVANIMKYEGQYVATPVNVHRVNWLWVNPEVLEKAGVQSPPETWPQFFETAEKIKQAGLIAVAHGGQNWQDFTTFESVALGLGGAQFYQQAFVELSEDAIQSDTMKSVFETFRKIKSYTDEGAPGRDWNLATAMVIESKAGMQLMGDWAKGEFIAAEQVAGKDFLCVPAPGTASAYTFNVDSFIMFKLNNEDNQKGQADLATEIMSPEFQVLFNQNKGSIPVRTDIDMSEFDECAQKSAVDFQASAAASELVPSIAHGMAVNPSIEGAIKDVVSQFWSDDAMSVDDAISRIVEAKQFY